MKLFRRTPRLPSQHRPPLADDERVLAWSMADAGERVVVVTNHGLWLPGHADRLGWHHVHKAVWSGRELAITPAQQVTERTGYRVVARRVTGVNGLTWTVRYDPGTPGDDPDVVEQTDALVAEARATVQ
ncbi:MAG TPA: hypothetical protein VHN18_20765, partial [Micromonosporaceae bacterium]|nr:hypothetical protein [Micromonosporaceae bacterium]